MIRRPTIETKINHERWLVSYSDFITLLFAFFVVMYSVSQVNESKYKILSETLGKEFSSNTTENQSTDNDDVIPQNNEPIALNELHDQITDALNDLLNQEKIKVSANEHWVDIELNAKLLFVSASAEPNQQAREIFTDLAAVLQPHTNAIAIAGHTDNVPINNGKYVDNWELSSARAVSIVNLLARDGVSPERLSAVGYGEYRPIADNSSEQGRAENRRVVVRVSKEAALLPAQTTDELFETSLSDETPLQEKSDAPEASLTPSPEPEPSETPTSDITPVKLKGGGLLFTSDPDLPRIRQRE